MTRHSRTHHFDALETRSPDEREAAIARDLPRQVANAQSLPGAAPALVDVEAGAVTSVAALAELPVIRKSDLVKRQGAGAPLGGLTALPLTGFAHVFQSPGPIYEPGGPATTGGAWAASCMRRASVGAIWCRTASAIT